MTHKIITSASHDAQAALNPFLPVNSKLNARQWHNFFATCFGFRDLSGAAAFERRYNVRLDDMFEAEAVILDRISVARLLAKYSVSGATDLINAIVRFLNEYWRGKRPDDAPVFYWSVSEYIIYSDKSNSRGSLNQSFFSEAIVNSLGQAPSDLPWAVELMESIIPEWPQGIVMPEVFKPSHNESSFLYLPMRVVNGDFNALNSKYHALFPRGTILGNSKIDFFWPRGITHHFTDAPSTPGFDDSAEGFSWSALKFGSNNSQSGDPIPLSSVIRDTILPDLHYGPLLFPDDPAPSDPNPSSHAQVDQATTVLSSHEGASREAMELPSREDASLSAKKLSAEVGAALVGSLLLPRADDIKAAKVLSSLTEAPQNVELSAAVSAVQAVSVLSSRANHVQASILSSWVDTQKSASKLSADVSSAQETSVFLSQANARAANKLSSLVEYSLDINTLEDEA